VAQHCPPGCGHLHFSALKALARSPAHYKYASEHGTVTTPAMAVGSAVHALVLEHGDGIVRFEGSRRGKEWTAFQEAHSRETILTASEWEQAVQMAGSVTAHPRAAEILVGVTELAINWKIGERDCMGRLDLIRPDGAIVELKTAADASPRGFQRQAEKLGYFSQLSFYLDGFHAANPTSPSTDDAYIVAVESKPPFVCQTFSVSPHAIDLGRRTYRLWLEMLAVCEASGEWPGYQESDVILDLPEDVELTIGDELVEV
jgi:exodeoxyribonuclease VIII